MIKIGIDPIIFDAGFFTLRWYSLAVLAAALVGIWWTVRAVKKEKMNTDQVYTLALWALPGGIVGSRLIHVLDQFSYYITQPGAIIGGQGEAITGAILGGALGAYIGAKVHKLNFGVLADLAAPGMLLAQFIGRIGCTINGDAFGTPTDLPWGVVYTNPNSFAPLNIATHPAVWYEMLWDMVVFGTLLKLKGKIAPSGSIFLTYLVMYSFGRFFIDFFRGNPAGPFGLHQAQLLTLLTLIVFIPILIIRTHFVGKLPPARKASAKSA